MAAIFPPLKESTALPPPFMPFAHFAQIVPATGSLTTDSLAEAGSAARTLSDAGGGPAALGGRLVWLAIFALVLAVALGARRELGRWAARRAGTAVGHALRHAYRLLPPFLALAAARAIVEPLGLAEWLGKRGMEALDFLLVVSGFFLVLLPAEALLIERTLVELRGQKVPRLVRDLGLWLVGGLFLAYAFSATFAIPLAPLFATSAVISFVLGLALQDTLSNLFAGLAVHFEGSVALGDWVRVAEQEGEVAGITWRAIKIRTFANTYVIVPNSTVAKSALINYSQPTPLTRRVLPIAVAHGVPPGTVERVAVEALRTIEGVKGTPEPEVLLSEFGESAIHYDVCFWTSDPSRRAHFRHAVYSALWYRFSREGIEIPFPTRTVRMRPEPRADSPQVVRRRVAELRRVDFLEVLADDDLEGLARDVEEPIYARDETILAQDAENRHFFLIKTGRVAIEQRGVPAPAPHRLAELGPGDFFGEYSVLTGDRTTAAVRALEDTQLLALPKRSFERLLQASPAAAETISRVLSERQAQREALAATESATARSGDTVATKAANASAPTLLAKMRRFFGLR